MSSKGNKVKNWSGVIPGEAPNELVVASNNPIGKQLLRKMGWREGQGVGPRLKSKKGIALPNWSAAGASNISTSVLDRDITFAPDNTFNEIIMPVPKADQFGIGYDPTLENPEFAFHRSLITTSAASTLLGTENNRYNMKNVISGSKSGIDSSNNPTSITFNPSKAKGTDGFAIDDADDDIYDNEDIMTANRRSTVQLEEVEIDSDEDELTSHSARYANLTLQ